jgi:predicted deacylase
LRSACRLDDDVAAGDLLATFITPFGDAIAEVVAPIAGTIWAARSLPAVRVGEQAFIIAAPA